MPNDRPSDALLNSDAIRRLLTELDEELTSMGESAELYVVGGAAMAIGYGARDATRDVDALFEPKTTVLEAAERVAARHGIGSGWLNDAVKGFMHGDDPERRLVLELQR